MNSFFNPNEISRSDGRFCFFDAMMGPMDTRNEVFWYRSGQSLEKDSPPLDADILCDAVVVGGGMAGITAADELFRRGYRVALLERDFCGAGASGKTSGFITPDSELELSSLIETYGPERARALWSFVLGGVELIRGNIESHALSCDYRPEDSLFVGLRSDREDVLEEYEARKSLGYESVLYDNQTLRAILGVEGYTHGVQYSGTFGMNSFEYCQGMKKVLKNNGVAVYEETPVESVDERGVTTHGHRVHANTILVCTDRFLPELGKFPRDVYHVQTFLAATRPLAPAEISRIFPDGRMMVWDSDLVYQYFRLTGDDRLLVGGSDILYTYRRREQKKLRHIESKIAAYIGKKFPLLDARIEYLWPGMLGVTKDLLPIMGSDTAMSNVWYIAAASGLPWAAALGRRAAERVHGAAEDPYTDKFFRPDRTYRIHPRIERLIGMAPTYALSHGDAKYRGDYPELARKVGREVRKAIV